MKKSNENWIEQQKILRVFKLIRNLDEQNGKTLEKLATLLECSERTVRRYIDLLLELGYDVEMDKYSKKYHINRVKTKDIVFTHQEQDFLAKLIVSNQPNAITESIQQKIRIISSDLPQTEDLRVLKNSQIIQKITEAIEENQNIRIIKYVSNNSNTISDRIVKPLEFIENFEDIVAFEISSGIQKNFKIKRIEDIEILDESTNFNELAQKTDLFGLSGEKSYKMVLLMTQKAKLLLTENFKDSKNYISKNDDEHFTFKFETDIFDNRGVGRFILGLPGHIKIIEPQILVEYIQNELKKFIF